MWKENGDNVSIYRFRNFFTQFSVLLLLLFRPVNTKRIMELMSYEEILTVHKHDCMSLYNYEYVFKILKEKLTRARGF